MIRAKYCEALILLVAIACVTGCRSRARTIEVSSSTDGVKKLEVYLRSPTLPTMKTRLRARATSHGRSTILTEEEIATAAGKELYDDEWDSGVCFCHVYWPSNNVAVALVKSCAGLLNWIAYDFDQRRLVSPAPFQAGMASAILKEYGDLSVAKESGLIPGVDPIAWVRSWKVRDVYILRSARKASDWVPE